MNKHSESQIDLKKIRPEDLHKLNHTNVELLEQLGLSELPSFDHLSIDTKYEEYKALYMKLIVMSTIIQQQHNEVFNKIRLLKENESKSESESESESDS